MTKKSGKKNGGGRASGTGILINKSETSVVKATAAVEPMNHFEQIQPKDDAEILRAATHVRFNFHPFFLASFTQWRR